MKSTENMKNTREIIRDYLIETVLLKNKFDKTKLQELYPNTFL